MGGGGGGVGVVGGGGGVRAAAKISAGGVGTESFTANFTPRVTSSMELTTYLLYLSE